MENNLSKQENTHSKGRDSTQSDGIVLEKKDKNLQFTWENILFDLTAEERSNNSIHSKK
jgi:hypothetical protein